jgi:hypothetical protein
LFPAAISFINNIESCDLPELDAGCRLGELLLGKSKRSNYGCQMDCNRAQIVLVDSQRGDSSEAALMTVELFMLKKGDRYSYKR